MPFLPDSRKDGNCTAKFAKEIRALRSRVQRARRVASLQPDADREMIVVKHQVRVVHIEWRRLLTNPNRPILRPSEGSKRKDDRNPNRVRAALVAATTRAHRCREIP